MKTEKEIRAEIASIERSYEHVLTGSLATIEINAPRAMMQLMAGSKLTVLHWMLGEKYNSRFTGKPNS